MILSSPLSPSKNPLPHWISAATLASLSASHTNAHRLASLPDAWVERFADDLLISYQNDLALADAQSELATWSALHHFSPSRIFAKFLPRQNVDRLAPTLIHGPTDSPLRTVVEENGVRFFLDFSAGYSAGLFIDQRANRSLIRKFAPKRLLNTFAYTCSFSLVAALTGSETVSVDLSKKSLTRGQENWSINPVPTSNSLESLLPNGKKRHRFYPDDVLSVLPRLARHGESFDLIILDPPTFSRGHKGRKFQAEHDLDSLLSLALPLAAPHAKILLSTNCTSHTRRSLESLARFALKGAKRSADFHTESPLPDIPPHSAAQTLWLFLR